MTTSGPVLVVDDDPHIRELLVDLLDGEGYPVREAANGAEALHQVEATMPSLVLLDMRMPVLDGWGFAREIAARGLSLPIIALTAATDAADWGAEIGAVTSVSKPFDLLDLLDAVERHHGPAAA